MQIGGMGSMDIQSMMSNMKSMAFQKGDTDQSGGISQAEFAEMGKNSPLSGLVSASGVSVDDAFARIDSDGDGSITEAEFGEFKPEGGGFPPGMSSDMMSTLLSLQEQSSSGTDALMALLDGGTESSESVSSGDDLLDSLFAALDQDDENA